MCNCNFPLRGVAGLALASVMFCAWAQTPLMTKATCVTVGVSAMEPLGDRAGHALQVGQFTCRIEGGPMDGGVSTGSNIYEYDGAGAVLLTGNGVARKAGATAAFQVTGGTVTLTMKDGKVVGFNSSGKGIIKLATGGAAELTGKTYSFAVHPIGNGQFVIESTYD